MTRMRPGSGAETSRTSKKGNSIEKVPCRLAGHIGKRPAVNLALALIAPSIIAANASALPPCQYEDGNTDGSECIWIDPGTGTSYHVDSGNYR